MLIIIKNKKEEALREKDAMSELRLI